MHNEEYEYQCPECTSIVSPDDKVCKYCGTEFHETSKEKEIENREDEDSYATRYITKKELNDLADSYFSNISMNYPERTFKNLFCGQYLRGDKIANAQRAYADYDYEKERVLFLYDSTVWGSAEKGFLMTDARIYYAEKEAFEKLRCGNITFSDILTIELASALMGFTLVINGNPFLKLQPLSNKEGKILQEFLVGISCRNLELFKHDVSRNKEIQNEMMSKVKNYMVQGEEIFYFAIGVYLDSFVCCTTHRIITYQKETWFSREVMRDLEYSELASIDSEEFDRDISLEPIVKPIRLKLHASGSHTEIETLQAHQIEEIKRIARSQKTIGDKSDVAYSNKMSIVKEIKGLKELLDSGAITQAEFDDIKKKLIADM